VPCRDVSGQVEFGAASSRYDLQIAYTLKHAVSSKVGSSRLVAFYTTRQCDNYNLKSHRQCNYMSRMNLSGYLKNVTVFCRILLRAV